MIKEKEDWRDADLFNAVIANEFIEKLSSCTSYNINLMDESGTIIASCDSSRIGTFHEIAFHIIKNHIEYFEVNKRDTYHGVYPGVNMLLVDHNHRSIGVVGITGDPSEVKPIALITKMAVETLIENERQKDLLYQRNNLKEKFYHHLLYEEKTNNEILEKEAEDLGYQHDLLRVPVLFVLKDASQAQYILEKIKHSECHSSQDMSLITRENEILVFKVVGKNGKKLNSYREIVENYLTATIGQMEGLSYRCYVGTLQEKLIYYGASYKHCQWLLRYMGGDQELYYFYDHIDFYMKSITPDMELHIIFNGYQNNLDRKFVASFVDMVDALKSNNYSLPETSKQMYIHKNTLIFRLEKIKERLDTNPIHKAKDRDFIEYLSYYLKRFEKVKNIFSSTKQK